ncbi:MAG: histidine kinase [Hyphomicrobiales bacterium]|nr:histidine kinase [Hyphomicrobiales bacterium]
MPSLIRFMTVIAVLVGLFYGAMFMLAMYFEPETREISKTVRNVKIK